MTNATDLTFCESEDCGRCALCIAERDASQTLQAGRPSPTAQPPQAALPLTGEPPNALSLARTRIALGDSEPQLRRSPTLALFMVATSMLASALPLLLGVRRQMALPLAAIALLAIGTTILGRRWKSLATALAFAPALLLLGSTPGHHSLGHVACAVMVMGAGLFGAFAGFVAHRRGVRGVEWAPTGFAASLAVSALMADVACPDGTDPLHLVVMHVIPVLGLVGAAHFGMRRR